MSSSTHQDIVRPAVPIEPITGILDAFRSHRIVALDEGTHGTNRAIRFGQEVMHAHLHVIPRFADEPYAGRGIRFLLKQG
jgi:hypothetical protein